MKENRSDCEVLTEGFKNVFNGVDKCFDTALDDKKSKMSVVGSVFGLGKSMVGLTLDVGICAIKNAPKAIVAVAAVKREVVGAIEEEVHTYKKQQQEDALNEKIKNLKITPRISS